MVTFKTTSRGVFIVVILVWLAILGTLIYFGLTTSWSAFILGLAAAWVLNWAEYNGKRILG